VGKPGERHQGSFDHNHNLCPGAIFLKKFLRGSAGKIISINSGIMMLPDNVFLSK
jgi:hypothetical protein